MKETVMKPYEDLKAKSLALGIPMTFEAEYNPVHDSCEITKLLSKQVVLSNKFKRIQFNDNIWKQLSDERTQDSNCDIQIIIKGSEINITTDMNRLCLAVHYGNIVFENKKVLLKLIKKDLSYISKTINTSQVLDYTLLNHLNRVVITLKNNDVNNYKLDLIHQELKLFINCYMEDYVISNDELPKIINRLLNLIRLTEKNWV